MQLEHKVFVYISNGLNTFSGWNNRLFLLCHLIPEDVELRADQYVVSANVQSEATT